MFKTKVEALKFIGGDEVVKRICRACGASFRVGFGCGDGYECGNCAIETCGGAKEYGDIPWWFRYEKRDYTVKCLYCHKSLVPVGNSRANGKGHDDWKLRQYHKKCWSFIERRLDNSPDSD